MFRRAAALASNSVDMLSFIAGKVPVTPAMAKGTIQWMERAMRLNPLHPNYNWWNFGSMLFALGRYTESADAYLQVPDFIDVYAFAAASLAFAHRDAEARSALGRALAVAPQFTEHWFLGVMNGIQQSSRR